VRLTATVLSLTEAADWHNAAAIITESAFALGLICINFDLGKAHRSQLGDTTVDDGIRCASPVVDITATAIGSAIRVIMHFFFESVCATAAPTIRPERT
jgi:hypothetical protein